MPDSLKIILLYDDDRTLRLTLSSGLRRSGWQVRAFDTPESLLDAIHAGEGHLLCADMGTTAPDFAGKISNARPELPILSLYGHADILRWGHEQIAKPCHIDDILAAISRLLPQNSTASTQIQPIEHFEDFPLHGQSAAMQTLYQELSQLCATDIGVLIDGAAGTGKELIARILHRHGARHNGPFVALNLAALPRDKVETALFGQDRNGLDLATRHEGRFAQAQGGILFIDEIGLMPDSAQAHLLRVLQDGAFLPVGSAKTRRSNVRILAATQRDLVELVEKGKFRRDLYEKLALTTLFVPALNERLEDIPELVRCFCAEFAASKDPSGKQKPHVFDRNALKILAAHDWPGNVRELENLVKRLCAINPERKVTRAAVEAALMHRHTGNNHRKDGLGHLVEKHLTAYFTALGSDLPPPGLYDRVLAEIERPLLAFCLAATSGNQIRAAEILGINRNTLRKKLKDLGMMTSPEGNP